MLVYEFIAGPVGNYYAEKQMLYLIGICNATFQLISIFLQRQGTIYILHMIFTTLVLL